MNFFTICLPTKPYLLRYVLTLYGDHSTVYIDPKTDFGDIILSKMSSNMHCDLKPAEVDARIYRLSAVLKLKVPMHLLRKLQHKDLTKHQVIRINRTLENMFEKDLCDIVSRAHDIMGIDRQVAIECFAANHGIQLDGKVQDVTFEALKKMEYRFRRENARHTVRKKIVQDLSCKKPAA